MVLNMKISVIEFTLLASVDAVAAKTALLEKEAGSSIC